MSSDTDVKLMTELGLESVISKKEKVFFYHRGIQGVQHTSKTLPILLLFHGYPQSSFMWRHIVQQLPADIPLFIPDLPGYGRSAPLSGRDTKHNKRVIGNLLNNVLQTLLPISVHPYRVLICGHDRGARVCHRLAVDDEDIPNFDILGSIFLDIVPTLTQWQNFSKVSSAVGTFHWPLLANVEIATQMIMAQGGGKWARTCLDRWAGSNETGLELLRSDNAMELYESFFDKESVIRASCDDYRAGAEEDVDEQFKDQETGRKIDGEVLVIYSADYLGKRYDVEEVWKEWMGKGYLEVYAIGDGAGHFVAEEAPEETAMAIIGFCSFYQRLIQRPDV